MKNKKLKTNRAVKKRFRRTKSGKFKKARAGKRHLLQSKLGKRKRGLRKADYVSPGMEHTLRRLLPYA